MPEYVHLLSTGKQKMRKQESPRKKFGSGLAGCLSFYSFYLIGPYPKQAQAPTQFQKLNKQFGVMTLKVFKNEAKI